MDKSLIDVQRYEMEIKKMIEILDNAHANFQQEKLALVKEIHAQEETIRELR